MSEAKPVAEVSEEGAVVREGYQELRSEGYGYEGPDGLHLSPLEAVYLVYKGRLIATMDGQEMSFRDLMAYYSRRDEMMWVMFTVYYDLRKRGRKPVQGPSRNSLVFKDPRGGLVEVYVLEESRMISLTDVLEMLEASVRNGRIPVLAIVDRHGDVTYYAINRFTPRRG